MKYKKGDKVKIVDESVCIIIDSKKQYCGSIMTIKKVLHDGYYFMEEDDGAWLWYEDMIEGLAFSDIEPSTGQLEKSDNGIYTINW